MAKAEETIVTAAKCYTEQEAAIICQHLAVNDVRAHIDGFLTASSAFYGFSSVNVWVRSIDADRAKNLLHSHLASPVCASEVPRWICYARTVVGAMVVVHLLSFASSLIQAVTSMIHGFLFS